MIEEVLLDVLPAIFGAAVGLALVMLAYIEYFPHY